MKNYAVQSVSRGVVFLSLALSSMCFAEAEKKAEITLEEVKAEKADPVEGKKIFGTCIMCHGANGAGVPNMGSLIAGKPAEEISAKVLDVMYAKFKLVDPKKAGMMMPMVRNLKAKQIADVSAYVASMPAPKPAAK